MQYLVRSKGGKAVAGISGPLLLLRERLPAALRDMSASLLSLVQRGIEAERSPDGVPWKRLAPATVKKRGSAHPILRVSGMLYRSLHAREGENSAYVATNRIYAPAHQFGARIKHKARTVTLYFRRDKKGVGNRFVKKSRSDFAQDARVGAHETNIPARPFLFTAAGRVPDPWLEKMRGILIRHMREDS